MGSRTGLLTRLPLAACVLLLSAAAAFAAPSSLRIRQAYLDFPSLTVYADLLDVSGRPVIPREAGQLAANIGGRAFDISRWSSFSAKDDGLLTVFLVDISASIGESRFRELQETISAWIRRMNPSDRAAVMTFGGSVSVVQGFTGEQNALLYAVQSLSAQDPDAQLNLGILRALELAKVKGAGLTKRRMILLCSDGFRETPGGATAEEVRNALTSDPIPIYTIFFDSPERESAGRTEEAQQLLNELGYDAGPVDGKLGPRTVSAIRIFQQSRGVAWDGSVSNELLGVLRTMAARRKESALTSAGEFSRRSGGQLHRAGTSPFNTIFDSVAASLDDSLELTVTLDGMTPDAAVKRLEITYSDGTVSLRRHRHPDDRHPAGSGKNRSSSGKKRGTTDESGRFRPLAVVVHPRPRARSCSSLRRAGPEEEAERSSGTRGSRIPGTADSLPCRRERPYRRSSGRFPDCAPSGAGLSPGRTRPHRDAGYRRPPQGDRHGPSGPRQERRAVRTRNPRRRHHLRQALRTRLFQGKTLRVRPAVLQRHDGQRRSHTGKLPAGGRRPADARQDGAAHPDPRTGMSLFQTTTKGG